MPKGSIPVPAHAHLSGAGPRPALQDPRKRPLGNSRTCPTCSAFLAFLGFLGFLGFQMQAQPLPVNLDLPTTTNPGTVLYGATNSITADHGFTISGSDAVTFTAGSTISLKPGFHATAGTAATTFHAVIGTPVFTITVTTAPITGLALTVNGTNCTSPCTVQSAAGVSHTIEAETQTLAGTRYTFSSWSDGGTAKHNIAVSYATYTATFTPQYYLTTSANPDAGGTVTPASGWYNSGASVPVSATPKSGYQFTGFSGNLSGTAPSQNLIMIAGPMTVTGNFLAMANPTSGPGPTHFSFITEATPSYVQMILNWSLTGANGCYVLYEEGGFYLADNSGLFTLNPGQSTTVSNSQCTLDMAASSVTPTESGGLQLDVVLSFNPSFRGAQNLYWQTSMTGWQYLSTYTAYAVPVAVNPSTATLDATQQATFGATVADNSAVTWSINPQTGTLYQTGLYVAPPTIAAQQTVTITATSVTDSSKTGSATITLMPPVTIAISPPSATRYASQTQQFTATVGNATDTGVIWTITQGAGTIDSSGFYTAPSNVPAAQTVSIMAMSVADLSKIAWAGVFLLATQNPPPGPVASCAATPNPAHPNDTVTFSASATGGTPPYTYSWSGQVTGYAQNISFVPTQARIYTASVIALDTYNRTSASYSCSVSVGAFSIAPIAPVTVAAGSTSAPTTATITPPQGSTSPVTFSYNATAWPASVKAQFDTAAAPSSWATHITVSADASAFAGTYRLPITATSVDGGQQAVTITVSVQSSNKAMRAASLADGTYVLTDGVEKQYLYYLWKPQCADEDCTYLVNVPADPYDLDDLCNTGDGVEARIVLRGADTANGFFVGYRVTNFGTATGQRNVTCHYKPLDADIGGDTLHVDDATPQLTGISPNTITQSTPQAVTFTGTGFGAQPPTLNFSPADVTVVGEIVRDPLTPTEKFTATLNASTAGPHTVTVASHGNSASGFLPGGGSTSTSGSVDLTVQPWPTVMITGDPGVPVNGTNAYNVQLSFNSSTGIQLDLTTASGSGSITFADGTTSMVITSSQTVTLKGVAVSSTADNIAMTATPQFIPFVTLASKNLSAVAVSIGLRATTGEQVSPTNDGAVLFMPGVISGSGLGQMIYRDINGPSKCSIGVEFVGTVSPSNYAGTISLRRSIVNGAAYQGSGPDPVPTNPPLSPGEDDTSNFGLRDSDPQSGGSGGKAYDLDAPGIPGAPVVNRLRLNFKEYAVIGSGSSNVKASDDFPFFVQMSCGQDSNGGPVFNSDIASDNRAGTGSTTTTWNLQ